MNHQNFFRIVIMLLLTGILGTQVAILYRMPNGNQIIPVEVSDRIPISVSIANTPLRVDVDDRIPISVSIDETPLPVEIENISPVRVEIDNTPLPVEIH